MNQLKKIAIGTNIQPGSFGGGNQFAQALIQYLKSRAINVTHDLTAPDIDLILVTDARSWLASNAFTVSQAVNYQAHYPTTPIIFRVNECDERKGTRLKLLNRLIAATSHNANHTVFISHYLQRLFPQINSSRSSVIRNGADQSIFNANNHDLWASGQPVRIVTHHWSSHPNKGWDIYQQLDQLVAVQPDRYQFTFIGNFPPDLKLAHTRLVKPISGTQLATELTQHHLYLTASRHEPAGMHHIEGALCGLPLLYRESGALPEYCADFGISFNDQTDFPDALNRAANQLPQLQLKMNDYPHTAHRMSAAYLDLFNTILNQHQPNAVSWPKKWRLQSSTAANQLARYIPHL